MENLKNIIFDLGNVILNIDTNLSKQAFEREGLHNFDELYTLTSQSNIFDNLEVGGFSEKTFYENLRSITGTNLSDYAIKSCWNALIDHYPESHIEVLRKSQKQYRTFILSNTNIIHYKYYTALLNKSFGINGLESLVEKAYFSHEIKMKKPDPEIFKFVLSQSGIKPEDTLFIDDSEVHVKSASKLGIKCLWLKNRKLYQHFDNNGKIKSSTIDKLY